MPVRGDASVPAAGEGHGTDGCGGGGVPGRVPSRGCGSAFSPSLRAGGIPGRGRGRQRLSPSLRRRRCLSPATGGIIVAGSGHFQRNAWLWPEDGVRDGASRMSQRGTDHHHHLHHHHHHLHHSTIIIITSTTAAPPPSSPPPQHNHHHHLHHTTIIIIIIIIIIAAVLPCPAGRFMPPLRVNRSVRPCGVNRPAPPSLPVRESSVLPRHDAAGACARAPKPSGRRPVREDPQCRQVTVRGRRRAVSRTSVHMGKALRPAGTGAGRSPRRRGTALKAEGNLKRVISAPGRTRYGVRGVSPLSRKGRAGDIMPQHRSSPRIRFRFTVRLPAVGPMAFRGTPASSPSSSPCLRTNQL
jgi:hypothetical protein